jgi:two-component system sensor histidine kinase HydH
MNHHDAELAELAGGFIHEIKNHLSTLGLNLQLLAEDVQEPQTQRERRALSRVQRLQGECQRLVEVANDFLRFARIKDLDLEATDLAKVIDEMIDFFGPTARSANIEIKPFIPADLPMVLLDRELFRQAMLNLFLNAEQAMPEGGELTIQASPSELLNNECRVASESVLLGTRHSSLVTLQIIDTGKGISPAVLPRVFQPFFSTKPGGTGLGLATTRRIVEAHGGTIDVQSEVGRGTQFTLRLRTAPTQLQVIRETASPAPPALAPTETNR